MSDYPDPDVIRVDDTYYMISTTMHMMPGAIILRSYNLLDWEFCSYVYEDLDLTPGQQLKDNKGVFGKGMWAASLRYHNGFFYVSFVCNDTGKTYLYTSTKIEGPWKKQIIPGFFHDMSVLFDDDGRTWVVSGNCDIHLTEFEPDLSAPKPGTDKIILSDDRENVWLGYEGSHFYKINGKYYLFVIHMPKGKMRTEACFVSDKIDGPYIGGDILCSDLGGWNSGCAQGGIVQANDGKWYGIVFQDHGALGRIPVLVPVTFDKNGFPVFGENTVSSENSVTGDNSVSSDNSASVKNSVSSERSVTKNLITSTYVPAQVTVLDNRPGYEYKPLWSQDFTNPAWQWNHSHDKELVYVTANTFTVKTDKLVPNVTLAANTLTHRTFGEHCCSSVKLDAGGINDGDFAGLCALEGVWGMIAITKEDGKYFLVSAERGEKNPKMNTFDDQPPVFKQKIPLENGQIELQLEFDLSYPNQSVKLNYRNTTQNLKSNKNDVNVLATPSGEHSFTNLDTVSLKYTLDHFMGVRSALFYYSTKVTGGSASFSKSCHSPIIPINDF